MGGFPADKCRAPAAFWRAIEGIGVAPAVVLRQARLPATLHLNPQGFVTTAQYFAIWRAVEELTDDPSLGIRLVENADTAMHPPSTLVAFYARDYRDGLHRIARFKNLCAPERLLFGEEKKGEFEVASVWIHATEPAPAIVADVTLAFLLELGRRGTGRRLAPVRVEFRRAGPSTEGLRAYFECPIHFGAPADKLVLKSEDVDRPFPGHNPELLQILTPALASALGEIQAHSSVSEQVKVVLKKSLASGRPELSRVARELGVSERTLQRRITDEGATFRDLLVEARQELGRRLLADSATDIDEVACLLGYQDASSFYRLSGIGKG